MTVEHLIEAAHHGNHHLLRVLLTCHKEVKMDERFNGEVTLCVSVWRAHRHCSRVLIELGADVNALTNYGESTLLGATAHGDYELVKLLFKHGVYINLVKAQGQNACTNNLAQNPSVHMEIEHLLSVAGEFCFKVTCNGQNFVQKYTPTGVTLIPVKQDRPYARWGLSYFSIQPHHKNISTCTETSETCIINSKINSMTRMLFDLKKQGLKGPSEGGLIKK